MIVNGVHPDVVDELPQEDALNLWKMYLVGAWGPAGVIESGYGTYTASFNHLQVFLSANKKNYKPKKPPAFEAFVPGFGAFLSGEKPKEQKQPSVADKVLNMFGEKPIDA